MKRTGKLLLCLALALALCLALLPGAARAASGKLVAEGSCGTNVSYKAYDSGELVISGTGVVEQSGDWENGEIWYTTTEPDGDDSYKEYWLSITKITIQKGVTGIADSAFSYFGALKSVTIPSSVRSIGEEAFYDCDALTGVYISDLAAWCGIVFGEVNSNPLESAHKLYLNGSLVTKLTIPAGVKSIGYSAFSGCSTLTSVTIPSSVKSIGDYAFYGCSGIKDVYYQGSEYDGRLLKKAAQASDYESEGSGNEALGNAAWHYSEPIEAGWQLCGDRVIWKYDSSTRKLTIKGSGPMWDFDDDDYEGSDVPWAAYRGKMIAVEIQKGVTSIESYAFRDCGCLSTVTIPSSVTSIGDSAFSGCSALKSVTIPASVKSIGYEAFYDCEALTGVYISDLAAWCGIDFGNSDGNPLEYAHKLYLNGSLVTKLTIPAGVKSIKANAFSECSSLTSVTITAGVTDIEESAFYDCSALVSVIIPSSVTSIGESAFSCCESLASVTIPTKVQSIGADAFYSSALTKITIPKSVKSVGREAFGYCSSLQTVIFSGTPEEIAGNAFSGVTARAYYPADGGWWKEDRVNYGGKLSWVPFHTLYTVKYNANGGKSAPAATVKADGETYTLSKDEPDRDKYCFKGWATAAKAGKAKYQPGGSYSADANVTFYAVWAPQTGKITGTSHSSAGAPIVKWKALTGAASYDIFRSATGKDGSFKLLDSATGKSYTDASAAAGKCYYYKVRGVTEAGVKGELSGSVAIYAKPNAPTLTAGVNEDGRPTLSWKSVTGASYYQVWRKSAAKGSSYKLVSEYTTSRSYTDWDAAMGKSFIYRVRAVAGDGTKGKYAVSAKLKCTLASPRVDVGVNEKGKPTLSWYTVDGAVKYEIWRSTTGKAGSFKKFATVTGTSWTNAKAALGKTFWYKVKAVASDGTKSGFSKVCKQKVVPAAPQVDVSYSAKGKPVLSWKTVKGAAKYEIWRSEGADDFKKVKTVTGKKYTDTKATPGKFYSYRVRAVMEDGTKGVYSSYWAVAVQLDAPTLTGALNDKGKPKLSWKPVDGAAEYQIWRSTTGELSDYELVKTVTGTSWTHSKAKSGKTYYYIVIAVSDSGVQSDISNIITLTAK